MTRLQTRLRHALQGLAARACNDWHRDLVPRACPVVRPRLRGSTGQRRIATNDVWVGYQCEEQQAHRVQSWHVAASASVSLAEALYRATPPLSTANRTLPARAAGTMWRGATRSLLLLPWIMLQQNSDALLDRGLGFGAQHAVIIITDRMRNDGKREPGSP